MQFTTTFSLLLAAVPALAVSAPPPPPHHPSPVDGIKKSSWKQQIFQGCCGTDALVDGNPNTVSVIRETNPISDPQVVLLTNIADTYKGLYILSSDQIITDYDVEAYNSTGEPYWSGVVGRVRGAKSALTAVNLWNEKGERFMETNYLKITVYGVKGKQGPDVSKTE